MGLARWGWLGFPALALSATWAAGLDPAADRVVVASMTAANFDLYRALPLPARPNQKICGLTPVTRDAVLGGVWGYAYVPAAAERMGDFSAFPGILTDPVSGRPFPGNIIPASRMPGVVAWRISTVPPAPGENCLESNTKPEMTGTPVVTGYGPADQTEVDRNSLTITYRAGDPQAPPKITVLASGGNQLYWEVVNQFRPNAGGISFTAPWVSVAPKRGLTPGSAEITVKPGTLAPGAYSTAFQIVPIGVVTESGVITVQLNLSVPGSYLQVQRPEPEVTFVVGQPDDPAPKTIRITTLGAASTFAAQVVFVSPPASANVKWLSVTPTFGSNPQDLTVNFNREELAKLDRGQYLAFVRITAPGAPNSPQTIPVMLNVFPPSDFTVTSDNPIMLTYTPGAVTEAARIGLNPVPEPIRNVKEMSFVVTAPTEDGRNWLIVTPDSFTGIPNRLSVSVNPNALVGVRADQYNGWVSIGNGVVTGAEIPVRLVVNDVNLAELVTTRVIAQIVDGAGWKTSITLINTDTGTARPFTLILHRGRRAVAPNIEFESLGIVPSMQIQDTIPPGGSRTLVTAGAGAQLWEGWAELQSVSAIDGTAIFRVRQSPEQDSEGGVPVKALESSRFLLPFDNTAEAAGRYDTGFAILNSSNSATATVRATVRNESGQIVRTSASPIVLGPYEHMAFSLPAQIPATAGIRGAVEFASDGPQIAGLGLRFSPRGNFTSFETISRGTTAAQKITHVADGSGWKTTLILVNPDAANPITVTIGFKAGLNTPQSRSLPLVGRSYAAGSTFNVTVPASSSVTIQSQGNISDPLWMGWAELNSSGPLNGFAVFKGDRSGIESEGAAPMLSGASSRFFMPFDNTNGVVTSVAVVNSGSNLSLTFRDPTGAAVNFGAGTTYSLPLQGHSAFELTQPQFRVGGLRGVAEFASDGPDLLGLGLRFNDARRAFTSLPVVRK
ncbi:MAG: hypothetical protein IT161_08945 [Bryobacterales bacterium]|nr:hypothetical protein [Bryobacterales bacterium]